MAEKQQADVDYNGDNDKNIKITGQSKEKLLSEQVEQKNFSFSPTQAVNIAIINEKRINVFVCESEWETNQGKWVTAKVMNQMMESR